jgi:hypothetical protein
MSIVCCAKASKASCLGRGVAPRVWLPEKTESTNSIAICSFIGNRCRLMEVNKFGSHSGILIHISQKTYERSNRAFAALYDTYSLQRALLWPLVADIGLGISPCHGDRPQALLKHLLSCRRHSSHSIACTMLSDRPTVSFKNNMHSRLPGSFPFIVKHISVGRLVPLYNAVRTWSLFQSACT